MTAFIGVDFSLTSTGIACFADGEWDACTVKTKPDDGTPSGFLRRMDSITSQILNWTDPREGDVIAIEAPAFGAKGAALDRMFGGWWMTVAAITAHHEEPWVFTSTSLKKLATGKGNAARTRCCWRLPVASPKRPSQVTTLRTRHGLPWRRPSSRGNQSSVSPFHT